MDLLKLQGTQKQARNAKWKKNPAHSGIRTRYLQLKKKTRSWLHHEIRYPHSIKIEMRFTFAIYLYHEVDLEFYPIR